MQTVNNGNLVALDLKDGIWDQFYTVAPLVVIGTKENNGYDLAPKHMAMPLGQANYFGFICTPEHATYHNVIRTGEFSVSFPRPDEVVMASLAATPRCGDYADKKALISGLPILPTLKIDSIFIEHSYLFMECELFRIFDGFDDYSLISGKIVACYIDEQSKRSTDKDDQELIHASPLMAYLAYGRFAKIKESFAFPFPKDFEPLGK